MIKRTSDGFIISIKSTRVADSRYVVFYSDRTKLKSAK